jgi:hypothetical protein
VPLKRKTIMRILGYIEHPFLKITVFKTDTRLSVQFEDGLCELTCRFRIDQQLEGLESIRQLVDNAFLEAVAQQLKLMQKVSDSALVRFRHSLDIDDHFEVII